MYQDLLLGKKPFTTTMILTHYITQYVVSNPDHNYMGVYL